MVKPNNKPLGDTNFTAIETVEPVVADTLAVREFVLNDGLLEGLSFKQPIVSGINEAQCGAPYGEEHEVPCVDHLCGFYAYDDPDKRYSSKLANYSITAIVRLSGKVLVCESGLRAERLEIVAISGSEAVISLQERKDLEDYYNVPVFKTRKEMLQKYTVTPIDRTVKKTPNPKEIIRKRAKNVYRPKTMKEVPGFVVRRTKSISTSTAYKIGDLATNFWHNNSPQIKYGIRSLLGKLALVTFFALVMYTFIYLNINAYGTDGVNKFGPLASLVVILLIGYARSIFMSASLCAVSVYTISTLDKEYLESVPNDVEHFLTIFLVNLFVISFIASIVFIFRNVHQRRTQTYAGVTLGAKPLVVGSGNTKYNPMNIAGATASNKLPIRRYNPKGGDNNG